MAIYTAALSAQNTSVYVCDVVKPRAEDEWFANALIGGTFGSGTVTLYYSLDSGVTKYAVTQDGTSSAAAATAASALNIRGGWSGVNANMKLYASIATATNPVIAITVVDNR